MFIDSLAKKKFSDQIDRDDLWPLLVTFTQRRANKWADHMQCQKRGGVKQGFESVRAFERAEALRETDPEVNSMLEEAKQRAAEQLR
jgi:hypothetical protein